MQPPPAARVSQSRFRVLLIEDDPELGATLQAGLAEDRISLTIAGNAAQALEAVAQSSFDLALLDLGLPGMSGLELLQQLKENPAWHLIPVIVLTAKDSIHDKLRCFELGAVDYVTKPFELVELRARIRSSLRLQRLQQELLQANHNLEAGRQAAEETARAKAEFLANMSHEIRTPMNGVIAMTSLLLQTDLAPDQRDFVETIRTSGESLVTIVDDILHLSKIASGKMELEHRPIDLRACVEESLELLAAKAAEKDLDLVYRLAPGIAAHVVGDVTRLRQILVNLLSNAVKFTPAGEIFVNVDGQPLPAGGITTLGPAPDVTDPPPRYELHFSVHDTGIGIPQDRLGRLFRSFSQVDSSITRRFGGTGLGLAISKGLVDLMGGKMWVESSEGHGSTFHFELPMQAADVATSPFDQPHPDLSGLRVLLLQERPIGGEVLAEQVKNWGMLPFLTSTVQQALDQVRSGAPFDLAILDTQLPGAGDATVTVALRSFPHLRSLPIVLLTAVGTSTVPASLQCAGCTYVHKPVRPAQLQTALLQVRRGTEPALKSVSPSPKLDPTLATRLPLRILLTDDNVINQKVALQLLQQLGYQADTANNGLEAVRAIERQPYDVIFMDVQMPELDGLDATRRIRERQREAATQRCFRQPIIIAMTANAMQGDLEKCLAAGMDDYLPKPVRPAKLQAILELHAAKLANTPASPADPPAQPDTSPAADTVPPNLTVLPPALAEPALLETPPVDLERLSDFAAGDLDNFNELVNLYLKQTSEQLEQMRTALAENNAEETSRLAHSCAGASATCGMVAILPLLRRLERVGQQGNLDAAADLIPAIECEFERLKRYLQTHRPIALAG